MRIHEKAHAIEGGTIAPLGDEFANRYSPHHYNMQKETEFIPGKKVVWLGMDSTLNSVEVKTEWKPT